MKSLLPFLFNILLIAAANGSASIPVANFSATHTSICEGQCISFTDLSINNPTSWSWSFQGASLFTSTQQNPSNICYFTAGTYFVSLTVSNASGSNTLYMPGYITVYPSSVVNLLTNGDFNNYNAGFNSQLTYVAAGTLSPDQYTVDTNAWYHNGGWAAVSPDTTPFYMSDGSLTSGMTAWSETVTNIFPSSAYTFSFLMTNLDVNHSFVEPELETVVTDQAGTVLFTGTTGLLPALNSNSPPVYVWTPFHYIFNTLPNTTSVTIALNQVGGTYLGFDFGLEDIRLKTHFCDSLVALPMAGIYTDENTLCPGSCADFLNLSTNATSYQWFFPGGTPAFSNDVSPQSVCYNNPGSYDVTLVATNANGNDTVVILGYMNVLPYPPPQGISQNGDTLFAITGAVSYQWYNNGVLIQGATNYYYVAMQTGNYNVVATDANGCEVEAVIFDVVAGLNNPVGKASGEFLFYPNPVADRLNLNIQFDAHTTMTIRDVTGRIILQDHLHHHVIDCSSLQSGIYWMQLSREPDRGEDLYLKFVKL